MKKLLLFIIVPFLYLPHASLASTADEIKSFFDKDHARLLDYYWLNSKEIYDQWTNHSRYTTSRLHAVYHRKRGDKPYSIIENLKDYLGDQPMRWSHQLQFSKRFVQGYKKSHRAVFEQYEIREEEGYLKIYNKEYHFAIGTFDKDGKYTSRGFYENTGGLDLDFWLKVFYDPWDQKMWFHELLSEDDEEKYRSVKYKVNADHFFFRFKNETRLRPGKLVIKNLPGFRHAIVLLSYQDKNSPLSREQETHIDWTDQEILFDIKYEYDVERLSIDPDGSVRLNQTYEDFLKLSNSS
ncbi:MAG: hypothetical protein HYW47_04440 [Deltaproteobacteria bacterium]|nr:hypothetical protein [Deltaproteobacteria bacterium]